ncbi:MAG: hypothetical protein JWO13_974 [Acidobacteriales bacterium]|nr:hypothetical protein [Terriglobales bacterium]
MPDADLNVPSTPHELEAESFYAGAYSRIVRLMVVVAAVATVGILARWGSRVGLGFALGCGIAGVNFMWIKRSVNAFADRIVKADTDKPAGGSATSFALRFGLLGAVGYVIFMSSIVSLSGLLAGLFLPVAAILLEAMYETYVALRRGL